MVGIAPKPPPLNGTLSTDPATTVSHTNNAELPNVSLGRYGACPDLDHLRTMTCVFLCMDRDPERSSSSRSLSGRSHRGGDLPGFSREQLCDGAKHFSRWRLDGLRDEKGR
jgi:hypothetical protein